MRPTHQIKVRVADAEVWFEVRKPQIDIRAVTFERLEGQVAPKVFRVDADQRQTKPLSCNRPRPNVFVCPKIRIMNVSVFERTSVRTKRRKR